MNDCVADVEVGVMLNLYDSASTVISYFLGNLMFCMINIHICTRYKLFQRTWERVKYA